MAARTRQYDASDATKSKKVRLTLVVDHEGAVNVLEGRVGREDGVVGLNDRVGHLGGGVDGCTRSNSSVNILPVSRARERDGPNSSLDFLP